MNSFRSRALAVVFSSFATAALAAPCPSAITISVPPSGCRLGSATASVAPLDGATYAWSVTGGTIANGDGTPRIVVSLGDEATTRVSVIVTAGDCKIAGESAIALREPLAVKVVADAGRADEALTIRWSYGGGQPASQTLGGTDFSTPVALDAGARSYTYTPSAAGTKDVWIEGVAAAASSAAPRSGRHRAAARAGETASGCTAARSMATYDVDQCAKPSLAIEAPKTVLSGAVFDVRAMTNATSVQWTIKNGSPASWSGPSVRVRAGDKGVVEISATAQRGTCTNLTTAASAPAIVTELTCDNPVARVSTGASDCTGGTIVVSFEGTPPFRGTWSDGVLFETEGMSMMRRVTAPGSYSITTFQDGTCAGTSTGSATFASAFYPTATITSTGSCANDVVTAQFTGTPPFVGVWSDGATFSTTATTLQRPAAKTGVLTITQFDDAHCRGQVNGWVNVFPNPTVKVRTDWPVDPATNCYPYPAGPGLQNEAGLAVDFEGDSVLPLTVNWSDGTVSTANGWPVRRYVLAKETTTYTVASARDARCEAVLVKPSVTLWISQRPEVSIDKLDEADGLCDGVATTAKVAAVPPGTTVNWNVQNGTITGGQGTATLSFTTTGNGPASVTCNFTFNDQRCPIATTKPFNVYGTPPVPQVTITPSKIKPGGTAVITYTLGVNTAAAYLTASRNDEITAIGDSCPNNTCQAQFRDLVGAGTATITVNVKGHCLQPNSASATVTIEP